LTFSNFRLNSLEVCPVFQAAFNMINYKEFAMRKESLAFLKELLTTPSPSGFERAGQRVWLDYASQYTDKTFTDTYGSAVGVLNPDADPKVLIVGHSDEIGLMVNHIDDKGFVYVCSIGGIDAAVVPGKRLTIHTDKGQVRGITGATAIHLRDRDNEQKPRKLHELYVDIGASSKKAAEKKVKIGDPITFVDDFEMMGKNIAVARALDNRIGTWIAAETLRLIRASKKELQCSVYAASCVQEEIGLRGSLMTTIQVKPDIGLVSDVGHATDSPGIDHRKHGECKLGGGPQIAIGGPTLPEVNDLLIKVAAEKKIPLQRSATPGGSGTDTDSVFKITGGVACGLISLPIRYMHTTVEMTDLRDLEQIPILFAEFCLKLKKGQRFKAKI
jgi:putative aminopeptidase FrvX